MVLNRPENVALLGRLNELVMQFSVSNTWQNHPKVHLGLNPFYLEMRQELDGIDNAYILIRRERLRNQLIQDFLQEDKELREIDLAYTNTQP